jgi:hypothetical protein
MIIAIRTSALNSKGFSGLDAFVDHLESGAAIILADMGAGSGQVASLGIFCPPIRVLSANAFSPNDPDRP